MNVDGARNYGIETDLRWFATNEVELYANVAKTVWGINIHNALTLSLGMSWGFELFGGRDLGVWEQGDDPDADMDDWLLEGLEGDEDDGEENEVKDKKPY